MFLSDKLEADLRGLIADWRALAQAKLAESKEYKEVCIAAKFMCTEILEAAKAAGVSRRPPSV